MRRLLLGIGSPEARAALARAHPADEARGFEVGVPRGVFLVGRPANGALP